MLYFLKRYFPQLPVILSAHIMVYFLKRYFPQSLVTLPENLMLLLYAQLNKLKFKSPNINILLFSYL